MKSKRYQDLKKKDPDNVALPYLNSEITFLRDIILPIILSNTTVDYAEIRNFVTRSLRELESHPLAKKTTDLLLHIHLKDPEGMAITAMSRTCENDYLDMQLYVNFEKSYQYDL